MGVDPGQHECDYQGQNGVEHPVVLLHCLHCPGHHSILILLGLEHPLDESNVLLSEGEEPIPKGVVLLVPLPVQV